MTEIEQQLAAVAPRLRELEARIEAAHGPREAAMQLLFDLDLDRDRRSRRSCGSSLQRPTEPGRPL
jgi:hypothetical protein